MQRKMLVFSLHSILLSKYLYLSRGQHQKYAIQIIGLS